MSQKSLLSLARAIVSHRTHNTRLLLLDEATASLDAYTEARIQDVIRKEFRDRGVTVVAVAHRLRSLEGFDEVVEMGNGRVLGNTTLDAVKTH